MHSKTLLTLATLLLTLAMAGCSNLFVSGAAVGGTGGSDSFGGRLGVGTSLRF